MVGVAAYRLELELQSWDSSLEAGMGAWRLGLEPQGWDWSLKAETEALRLGFKPKRGGMEYKKEKEKEKEKLYHMCESIGQRLLRGRCPKSMKHKTLSIKSPLPCKFGVVSYSTLTPKALSLKQVYIRSL